MKIGILGYGTVASGLVDIIDNNKDKRDISIEGILVRDVKKHEHRKHADVLTDNIEDIFKKDVDVIVELLGGLHPSYEYLKDDTDFKKIRKLKKVIQKVESNPYEMLFDSIPNISESDNLNDTFYWIKESKKLFDGYFDWMVKNIVNVIYQLIAPNSKDDLYHILKEWYEKQSAQLKQGLFDGKVTQFV